MGRKNNWKTMNGIVVSPLPPKPVHINSQCDSLCPSPLPLFPIKKYRCNFFWKWKQRWHLKSRVAMVDICVWRESLLFANSQSVPHIELILCCSPWSNVCLSGGHAHVQFCSSFFFFPMGDQKFKEISSI